MPFECEYAAARNGLSGLAQGTSRHAWITARMERVATAEKRLAAVVGNEQAMELVLARFQVLDAQADRKAEAIMQQSWQIQEQADPLVPVESQRTPGEAGTKRTKRSSLLLDGRVIHEGDQLVLHIFDGWITGEARQDRTDWYLLTATQVRVRLSAGLTARWAETAPLRHRAEAP